MSHVSPRVTLLPSQQPPPPHSPASRIFQKTCQLNTRPFVHPGLSRLVCPRGRTVVLVTCARLGRSRAQQTSLSSTGPWRNTGSGIWGFLFIFFFTLVLGRGPGLAQARRAPSRSHMHPQPPPHHLCQAGVERAGRLLSAGITGVQHHARRGSVNGLPSLSLGSRGFRMDVWKQLLPKEVSMGDTYSSGRPVPCARSPSGCKRRGSESGGDVQL